MIVLEGGGVTVVDEGEHYRVRLDGVTALTIQKRGYNTAIESLRLAFDVIEHIEDRR
jgi:hypothetical protein